MIGKSGFTAFCVTLALLCASCATGELKSSEKKSPKELGQLYVELGTQALLRGDFPQAVEDLRKALNADYDNAVAHNHLAIAYYSLGKKQQARDEINVALRVDPNYSDAYVNLGNFALDEKNLKLARSYFSKALDNLEYKLRHRALTNLAQVALAENNIDEARQLLYQSIQTNPDYCLSHFLLGSIFMRERNATRAAEEFRKSIMNTCNSNPEAHYQLGLAYVRSKEFTKARSEFVYLVEHHPQTLQAQHAGDQLRYLP